MQGFYSNISDIPYNFLIGGDGYVYESRGFPYQGQFTHRSSSNFNDFNFIVAFIGRFNEEQPSERQIETFDKLMRLSVELNVVNENYTLLLQDQLILSRPRTQGLLTALKGREDIRLCKKIFLEKFKVTDFIVSLAVLDVTSREEWKAWPAIENEKHVDPVLLTKTYKIIGRTGSSSLVNFQVFFHPSAQNSFLRMTSR